jgi:hypothetical protein
MADLDLEILRVQDTNRVIDCIKELKSRMIDLHKPIWDVAHQQRVADLQSGRLKGSR